MTARESLHPRGLGYATPTEREQRAAAHQLPESIVYKPKRAYKTDRPLSRPVAFVKGRAQPLMVVDNQEDATLEEQKPNVDRSDPGETISAAASHAQIQQSQIEQRTQDKRAETGAINAIIVNPANGNTLSENDSDEDNVVYVPPAKTVRFEPTEEKAPVPRLFSTPAFMPPPFPPPPVAQPNFAQESPVAQVDKGLTVTSKQKEQGAAVNSTPIVQESLATENIEEPTKSRRAKANEKRNNKREARRARKRSGGSFSEKNAKPFQFKKDNRRMGSDVEWGDETDVSKENVPVLVEEQSFAVPNSTKPSPENDADLTVEDLDLQAMATFVRGADNLNQHTTADDIADERRLREESEDEAWQTADSEGSSASDGEDLIAIEIEERLIIGESSSDELGGDSSDDDSESGPRRKGKQRQSADDSEDSDEDYDDDTWRTADAALDKQIASLIKSESANSAKSSKRKRNKIFQAIEQGDFTLFDDDEELLALSARNKGKGRNKPLLSNDDIFMQQLQAQWERDKDRKSERKRNREMARLQKRPTKQELKKAKKMGLEPKSRIGIDLHEIHANIQSFLMTPEQTHLSLPPMGKKDRVAVHLLAECYYLKSQSKGSGAKRYPILDRTAHSTLYGVNDVRIQSILRASDGDFSQPYVDSGKRKSRTNALFRELQEPGSSARRSQQMRPKNRDGDIVGQHAAQLQDDNVGFRLLAKMGWTEGANMGLSGGISAPISAVIKTSRTGLGA